MKVLVTGASGMLGAGVARALAARGDAVTVLQRRPAGLGLAEVLADVADGPAVRAAVAGHDAVVHLAAKVNVVGPWPAYQRANVLGTRAVLDACRATGVTRLVQVSSPSVAHAGSSLVGVGAEPADPEHARGPYARSKAISEREALAADGTGAGPLAVVAVRPHIVWGPGDPQLVARIQARAATGRLPAPAPPAAPSVARSCSRTGPSARRCSRHLPARSAEGSTPIAARRRRSSRGQGSWRRRR